MNFLRNAVRSTPAIGCLVSGDGPSSVCEISVRKRTYSAATGFSRRTNVRVVQLPHLHPYMMMRSVASGCGMVFMANSPLAPNRRKDDSLTQDAIAASGAPAHRSARGPVESHEPQPSRNCDSDLPIKGPRSPQRLTGRKWGRGWAGLGAFPGGRLTPELSCKGFEQECGAARNINNDALSASAFVRLRARLVLIHERRHQSKIRADQPFAGSLRLFDGWSSDGICTFTRRTKRKRKRPARFNRQAVSACSEPVAVARKLSEVDSHERLIDVGRLGSFADL